MVELDMLLLEDWILRFEALEQLVLDWLDWGLVLSELELDLV